MSGIVLVHVTMSLDGLITGPGDDWDWMSRFIEPNPLVDQVIASVGAVLSGRRGYDLARRPGLSPMFRKPYGGAWNGPQFVLTHHPPQDEEDETITFLSGDIPAAVATARRAAGDKNLLVLGASIARQCFEAGLVDEILIHLVPLMLGDGVRFFDYPGGFSVDLQPIYVSQAGQVTNLRFRVVKQPPAGD